MNKATSARMFRFMDLPREIRDMIYVHALVTDQHLFFGSIEESEIGGDLMFSALFAPYSLSMTLLNVCKTIYTEATLIFYGKNIFALPDIESKMPSPFISKASLVRRVVVILPSAGFHTTWKYASLWKIQPLLDAWRVMLRNLASFTNLDVVEVDVSELCDAAFYIEYVEGYKESLHGKSTHNGSPTALKYLAGQIMPNLSAGLAPSRRERESGNQLNLRVTGRFEWQRKVICEKWEELGADYVETFPTDDDDSL